MNELIVQVVTVLIVPILGALSAYVVKLINAKIKSIKSADGREFLQQVLLNVEDIINTSVKTTAETYVKQLKKDGNFNIEEQKIAFQKTYDDCITIIPDYYIKALKGQLSSDGFDKWLKSKIENYVAYQKETVITDIISSCTDPVTVDNTPIPEVK